MQNKLSVIYIALAAMLAFAALQGTAFAASRGACSLNIGVVDSNASVYYNADCSLMSLNFSHAYNSSFYCSSGDLLGNVTFGQNTYNNTLYNCTFSDSHIMSFRNASNNLASPYGNYSLGFEGNRSNIAIGYFFNFVSLDMSGKPAPEGFVGLIPYSLASKNIVTVALQNLNFSMVKNLSEEYGVELPRFGVITPTGIGNSSTHFLLDVKQIYRNRVLNFSPYWMIVPFWGHDILSFKVFNITGNMNYTPTYIKPDMTEGAQLPDNTNVYWNYTIVKYSHAPNMTAYLWSGYQVDPNGHIIDIVHNVTNETIHFDRGIQTPGIHETIGVLKSPSAMEQDNSTTETYSIGLSYCTQGEMPITNSGYYTLVYSSLHLLNTFTPSNTTCENALTIYANNVTLDCNGGRINSTNQSILGIGADNLTIKDCNIHGNGLLLKNAKNASVLDSSFYANSFTDTAVNANQSSLRLSNVSFYGYNRADAIMSANSDIAYSIIAFYNSTRAQANQTRTTKPNATNSTTTLPLPRNGSSLGITFYLFIIAFAAFVAAIILLYALVSKGRLYKR